MVVCSAALDLSDELVSFVGNVVAARRGELRSPWRVLTSFGRAVLTLVWLRGGDAFAQLGGYLGVSTDTVWRYATEAMTAPAVLAPTLAAALGSAGPRRRMVLGGTLVPATRCAARPAGCLKGNQDAYYSGKHHQHAVTVQALMGMDGEPAFTDDARCGSTRDLTAARADGIVDAAAEAGMEIPADSGYRGAGGTVRTPVKRPKHLGHNGHEKRADQAHAATRAPGERGFAVLNSRRALHLVRISPCRATDLVKAVLVITQKRSSLARA